MTDTIRGCPGGFNVTLVRWDSHDLDLCHLELFIMSHCMRLTHSPNGCPLVTFNGYHVTTCLNIDCEITLRVARIATDLNLLRPFTVL